jgi:hypothetical protein
MEGGGALLSRYNILPPVRQPEPAHTWGQLGLPVYARTVKWELRAAE